MTDGGPEAKKRILLIDDSAFYLAQLRDLLHAMGYEVAVCGRARDGQALLLAEHERLDLLLIDLKMPEMDGFAVMRWLREQPWGAEFKVMVLTGAYELSEIVRPLRELGVLGLVDKGAHPHHLLARINAVLHPDVARMRRSERVACLVPVTFTWGAFRKQASLTHLSLGGCFLITLDEIPIEAAIEVEAVFPGARRPHRLKGRVVWRMGGEGWNKAAASVKGIGVQWKDASPEAGEDMERFIAVKKEEERLYDLIGP